MISREVTTIPRFISHWFVSLSCHHPTSGETGKQHRHTQVGVEANDRFWPRHSGERVLHGALVPLGEGGHGEGAAHNVLEDDTPPVDRARGTQDDILLRGGTTQSHDQSQ